MILSLHLRAQFLRIMKIKTIIAALFLGVILQFSAQAQVKIGYTNIELVLAYMPETQTMEKSLGEFQGKLAQRLKTKDDYLKAKYQEYLELKEANRLSPAEAETKEKELMKLDEEVKKMASDSEYELLAKRQELLEPILKKLQENIDALAEAKNFTYILNQTTSAGVSTILFGPEENDITKDLMGRLGIKMPDEAAGGGE